jgi:hypothetical protein
MHIRHNKPSYDYTMNGQNLSKTDEEKDVGVYMNNTLRPAHSAKWQQQRQGKYYSRLLKTFTTEIEEHTVHDAIPTMSDQTSNLPPQLGHLGGKEISIS